VDDRRRFLLKVAQGVAYATPVMYTMASPPALLAQQTSGKADMGVGMGMLVVEAPLVTESSSTPTAPWAKKPPGG